MKRSRRLLLFSLVIIMSVRTKVRIMSEIHMIFIWRLFFNRVEVLVY